MAPWVTWEDYLEGMYWPQWTSDHVCSSEDLLADPDLFLEVAREMVRMWPVAAYHNLRNMWSGRNAWVGQASCLYAHGAPAGATRAAWGTLTIDQQRAANAIAERVRIEWEQRDVSQTLFAV
jgi:hypothetical protein